MFFCEVFHGNFPGETPWSQCGTWTTTGSELTIFPGWLLVYTQENLKSRVLSCPQAFCTGIRAGTRKHAEYRNLNSNSNLPIHPLLPELNPISCVGFRIPIYKLRNLEFLSPLVILSYNTLSLCSVQGNTVLYGESGIQLGASHTCFHLL